MPVILIVEDDAAIVHALTEYLASEGFGAQAAAGEREALACYYPVSGDGEALWGEEPLRLPLAEAQIDRAYAIGRYLREPVFGLPTVSFALVYPYSLKEAVLGSAYDLNETEYAFQAANHARSYSAMENELAAAGMDA